MTNMSGDMRVTSRTFGFFFVHVQEEGIFAPFVLF